VYAVADADFKKTFIVSVVALVADRPLTNPLVARNARDAVEPPALEKKAFALVPPKEPLVDGFAVV
jgi:hypothetical protein